jgi:hypothetical protein
MTKHLEMDLSDEEAFRLDTIGYNTGLTIDSEIIRYIIRLVQISISTEKFKQRLEMHERINATDDVK